MVARHEMPGNASIRESVSAAANMSHQGSVWSRGASRRRGASDHAVPSEEALAVNTNYSNWLIGYAGLNDAVTALGNAHNSVLEFNGGSLTYSSGTWNVSGVEDGTYTFWGYEHLLYLSSLTGSQLALAQEIGTEILTATAPVSGVEVSSITVHREYDGGPIVPGGNPPNSP
jgi:hypothetical protein